MSQEKQDRISNQEYVRSAHLPTLRKPLEAIIASSKLADQIYSALERTPQGIQLRFLAMRMGTSPAKCMENISLFEKQNFFYAQHDT